MLELQKQTEKCISVLDKLQNAIKYIESYASLNSHSYQSTERVKNETINGIYSEISFTTHKDDAYFRGQIVETMKSQARYEFSETLNDGNNVIVTFTHQL